MSLEKNRSDLVRHSEEMERNEAFNYCLVNASESAIVGCVAIYPTVVPDSDAEVSWWTVDQVASTDLPHALETAIPAWLDQAWPFATACVIGRDISWTEWARITAG